MISFETSRSRRVVGRLERGEPIIDGLLGMARRHEVRTGWITAVGALEWVEIGELDQRSRTYKPAKRFDAPCEILSLVGNVSRWDGAPFLFAHIMVSGERGGATQVLGGHLVGGSVYACEVFIECLDELDLVRTPDAATGLALWRASGGVSASVPIAPPASGRGPSWADAAAASTTRKGPPAPGEPLFVPPPLPAKKRAAEEIDLGEEPIPVQGDWIDHQQFGLCEVLGEDPDGAMLIRLPSGVHKSIRLDYLRVLAARPDPEGGRRIYPIEPRRR